MTVRIRNPLSLRAYARRLDAMTTDEIEQEDQRARFRERRTSVISLAVVLLCAAANVGWFVLRSQWPGNLAAAAFSVAGAVFIYRASRWAWR